MRSDTSARGVMRRPAATTSRHPLAVAAAAGALVFSCAVLVIAAEDSASSATHEHGAAAPTEKPKRVLYKCCASDEVMVKDDGCRDASEWQPPDSVDTVQWEKELHQGLYDVQVGPPRCATTQGWPLYHYEDAHDELQLLDSGRLRHYTRSHAPPEHPELHYDRDPRRPPTPPLLGPGDPEQEEAEAARDALDARLGVRFYHDYAPGAYCIDRIVGSKLDLQAQYAVVCAPHLQMSLNSTDFIMRQIVNPVCHGIAIACYLLVAVLYFVLPQLRDLVGNMLTTLAICLIVSQAADLVSIFTQYSNHVSFLVADVVTYISLLAAFFWLNSLGCYIWKTFRSRNVFLRVTDARKYCYYSTYAWGATICMAVIALFAHFMLDATKPTVPSSSGKQETIGRLGIAVFFTPIAFTILVNIFFYLTTGQAISRIATRGRIHHKMKYCFDMFVKLFLVMAVAWLFLVLARLPYDALAYCNIVVNLLQAFFFLYITVLGQKRVTMLIRQAFCSNPEGQDAAEWGEEMSPMSSNHY